MMIISSLPFHLQCVCEIFNRPPSLEGFHRRQVFGGFLYTQHITLPSGHYEIQLSFETESRVVIAKFYTNDRIQPEMNRSGGIKRRDYKDIIKVLSVIKSAFDAFIQQYRASMVIFHGSLSEPSRLKLYHHYAQRIARQYHGELIVTPQLLFMEYRIILPIPSHKE